MNKYNPLETFFANNKFESVKLTLSEIEKIIGDSLPLSASKHSAWWANDTTHVQAQAWLNAGWKVGNFFLGEWVDFIRTK